MADVLPFPAREPAAAVDAETLRQVGRCAFGIRYAGDGETEPCDLRERGLYCRTHNPHGRREEAR